MCVYFTKLCSYGLPFSHGAWVAQRHAIAIPLIKLLEEYMYVLYTDIESGKFLLISSLYSSHVSVTPSYPQYLHVWIRTCTLSAWQYSPWPADPPGFSWKLSTLAARVHLDATSLAPFLRSSTDQQLFDRDSFRPSYEGTCLESAPCGSGNLDLGYCPSTLLKYRNDKYY
jgi:hypothetical protein